MPVTAEHQDLYEYSKTLDDSRDELQGLPYATAFKFMAGVGEDPEEREGSDRALWQLIEADDEELSDNQVEWAEQVVSDYPLDNIEQMKQRLEWQRKLATLFDVGVNFDKYDYRFATDLIEKVNEDDPLSINQQRYLEMFTYRYREQLREKTIYAEDVPDDVEEVLGDDPRETMSDVLEDCKPAYEGLKNDGD